MVACSIGDATVLTGAAGFRVEGVNCDLGALSVECSIGAFLEFIYRALRRSLVTVTMTRSYQSAAGYGGRCTRGVFGQKHFTAEIGEREPRSNFLKLGRQLEDCRGSIFRALAIRACIQLRAKPSELGDNR